MIRKIVLEDIDTAISLAHRCNVAQLRGIDDIDFGVFRQFLEASCGNIDVVPLVYIDKDIVRGMFLVGIQRPWLTPNKIKATEILWYADPLLNTLAQGRIMINLLRAMESVLQSLGGVHSLSIGIEPRASVQRLLEKSGYKIDNIDMVKEI